MEKFLDIKPIGPTNKLRILVLVTSCNGFGDLMFAYKIVGYLTRWYSNSIIKLASTVPKQLEMLGFPLSEQYQLIAGKRSQCRRFALLSFADPATHEHIPTPFADLLLIAPLQSDFKPLISDVKKLLPYADKTNCFFFSEYNHPDHKYIDFPLGIGRGLMGLTLTDPMVGDRMPEISNPYALAYIADIDGAKLCINSFFELITKKYSTGPCAPRNPRLDKSTRTGPCVFHNPRFDIVVPPWLGKMLINSKRLHIYNYTNIRIIFKRETELDVVWLRHDDADGEETNIFSIRADILPVKNADMLRLMKHSVKDILVTGDQSITDVLSCCVGKNIFYQIASWKQAFAHKLAQNMPNKYLKSTKTSCGTVKAIRYNSNYDTFIKQWDFRRIGKSKLDHIVNAIQQEKLLIGSI